jgi:two-component system response regulator AtoC
VRELRGVLEAASNLAEEGTITPQHLRLPEGPALPAGAGHVPAVGELKTLAEVERRHILAVYDALGRNKTRAAQVLGIGLQTLHRRLKSYETA